MTYQKTTRRFLSGITAGAMALSFFVAPFTASAAGTLNWGPEYTAETDVSYSLTGFAFSPNATSKIFVAGTKEESVAPGAPRDIYVDRRNRSDGTPSGAYNFGTLGEDEVLHATVASLATTTSPSNKKYVLLISFNENDNRSEITKFSTGTGSVIGNYVSDPGIHYYTALGEYDAINNDTNFYVAGNDENTGAWVIHQVNPSCACSTPIRAVSLSPDVTGRAYAMSQDDDYLYGGGYKLDGTNKMWHLEKIRKSDFGREWAGGIDVDFSATADDVITAISVNDSGVFVGGYDSGWADTAHWSVRKFSKSSGAPVWVKNGGVSMPEGEILSVAADPEHVYVAGRDIGSNGWRIEKRDGETGDVGPDSFGTGGVVAENYGSGEYISAIAYEGGEVFLGGTEGATGTDTRWVVESRTSNNPVLSECSFTTPIPAGKIRVVSPILTPVNGGKICSIADSGCSDTSGPFSVTGVTTDSDYDITALSFDNHVEAGAFPQLGEQWKIAVLNNLGDTISVSKSTDDLRDYTSLNETLLVTEMRINGITSVSISHANPNQDTSDSSSVKPICLAFDRYPQCSDHIDNDGDVVKDIDDDSCHIDGDAGDGDATYDPLIDDENRILPACSDGVDNDVPPDGRIDYGQDVGCSSYLDTTENNPECSDGVDNSDLEDNLPDAADPNCHTGDDLANPYNPFDQNETQGAAPEALQCADGIDNDSDGMVDIGLTPNPAGGTYPRDTGCEGPNDVSEFNILRIKER